MESDHIRFVTPSDWKVEWCDRGLPQGVLPAESEDPVPASVPGAVQYDLIAAGRLKNPYACTQNALDAAWVAKNDWICRAVLDLSGFPQKELVTTEPELCFEGVDTFSEIWVNGVLIGKTENAYRVYRFPVPEGVLIRGRNVLCVRLFNHDGAIADKRAAAERLHRDGLTEGLLGKALIRRYQRSFYASSSLLNLGTGVLGIGINRPVYLKLYRDAAIEEIVFRTTDLTENGACAELLATVRGNAEGCRFSAELRDRSGRTVFRKAWPAQREEGCAVIVPKARLWWPNGYGEPYLYELRVKLLAGDGTVLDERKTQAGFRTVELIRRGARGEKTFFFRVNGKEIFVRGENNVPMDYIKVYADPDKYRRLFILLKDQGINLLRMWGGGAVESDEFYQFLDRNGILLWQDFFLHSNVYPDYDEAFCDNFRKECEGILRRVRQHTCLALICGGNELLEGWDEWGWKQEMDRPYGIRLSESMLPALAQQLCPDIPYIVNSPHGGKWPQSPVEGECHSWGNYYNALKDPLFVTETCWTTESYSRPETLQKVMDLPVDEYAGTGWPDRWKKTTSLPLYLKLPFSSWFEYGSLREYLHALEVEQARADYSALGSFRFHSPSNRGIIYWSMNKGGPLFQFGCVDYDLLPLKSYYVVKRLFRDVAVQTYRDMNTFRTAVSVHGKRSGSALVRAVIMDTDGRIYEEASKRIRLNAGQTRQLDLLKTDYSDITDRTAQFVCCSVSVGGKIAAEDVLLLCPISELQVREPDFAVSAQKIGTQPGRWQLHLTASAFAAMLEIESPGPVVCSDNACLVMPGQEYVFEITQMDDRDSLDLEIGSLGCRRHRYHFEEQ